MNLLRYILLLLAFTFALQGCKDSQTINEQEAIIYDGDDSVSILSESKGSFIVDIGGNMTINIPKETAHLVRVVDSKGFSEVPQDVKEFDSNTAHIKAAIEMRAKMLLQSNK